MVRKFNPYDDDLAEWLAGWLMPCDEKLFRRTIDGIQSADLVIVPRKEWRRLKGREEKNQ